MKASEVAAIAEEMLVAYKGLLLVDPFYRIVIEPVEGDYASQCKLDGGALSWRIILNPARHNDLVDIKYSVVDGLLRAMFAEMDRAAKREELYQETRDAVIARMTSVLCNLLPDLECEENDAELETSANGLNTQGDDYV